MKIAMLAAALLCFPPACTHARRAEPPAVRAEQNDAPAISPWAERPPHASIEEDPASTHVPADSGRAR